MTNTARATSFAEFCTVLAAVVRYSTLIGLESDASFGPDVQKKTLTGSLEKARMGPLRKQQA
jgi:hypothetical protein